MAPVSLWDTDFRAMQLADLGVARSAGGLDASRIRRGTYRYSFRFQGKPLGDLTVTVEETADGNVRVVQDLSGQITRSSSYVMTPDVSPLSVTNETHMGPLTLSQDLDYEGNRVTGQATVPEQGGGGGGPSSRQVSVDTALAEGTLDSNMDLAAVLGSPLAEGLEVQFPVFAPGQGVNSLQVTVTGRETVEVPAGSYETWAVEVQGPNQTVTLYVTREAPHLMVKQELSGQPITVELTGTGPGEAGSGS
jgi:phage tail protein X